jgi:hypothetical protein
LDSRPIAVEYHSDETPFASGRRASVERILAQNQSALILRGSEMVCVADSADISTLASAAKAVLYDDSFDLLRESHNIDPVAALQLGKCVDVVSSPGNADKNQCRLFLNQTIPRPTSPSNQANSLFKTPPKSIRDPFISLQVAAVNN